MTALSKLKLIKKIPKSVKYFVAGYTREMGTNLSLNIPVLIQSLCLLYYYQLDYFKKAHSNYEISKDKLTVTKISGLNDWSTNIFCNEWFESVSNRIIKWTFYVNKNKDNYAGILFILITKDNGLAFDYTWGASSVNDHEYCHFNSGKTYLDGKISNDASEFGQGDEIVYTLDLKKNEWKFQKGTDKECIIKSNVPKAKLIKYKLILSMFDEGDSVTLKNFSWSFA